MADFFSSDAGQHALIAKQFLEGALTLDAAGTRKRPILFRPTLALAGHGLEMMLKACWLLNDRMPPKQGRKGHDIVGLWKAEESKLMRSRLFENAGDVAARDRASGDYLDVPDRNEVRQIIEEYVIELGNLHSGVNGYALRYPSDPSQKAPRTPFLVKSLWRVADDLVKRPEEFKLRH